jgi:DhnA family fructose-bisphosphate aldolase class Ia
MSATIGKTLRLAEFWQEGQKSLLLDATLPGALGPMPGLEFPAELVGRLAPAAHGLIVNPGLAERFAAQFVGKLGAAPLIRLDWTNVVRPDDFVLPPRDPRRVALAAPADAVQIGAAAGVVTLLLGYNEDFEARNIQAIALACREAVRVSLPLLADVVLAGPKIDPAKRDAAIELGVSFMTEAGTDGIILPLPGPKALRLLLDYAPVPLFLRVETQPELAAQGEALRAALDEGVAGLVIGSRALAGADEVLAQARALVQKVTIP